MDKDKGEGGERKKKGIEVNECQTNDLYTTLIDLAVSLGRITSRARRQSQPKMTWRERGLREGERKKKKKEKENKGGGREKKKKKKILLKIQTVPVESTR